MLSTIWDQFLTIVRDQVGSRVVETWFKAVILHRWDLIQKTIYLQAPNSFVKDWLKNNYLVLFQTHLSRLLNVNEVKVVFLDIHEADCSRQEQASSSIVVIPAIVPSDVKSAAHQAGLKVIQKNASHVNSNYAFSNFIVGPSNSLAYAAAHAVTEKPGKLYNPLFIYGGSGLGKTHLLHAIGNEIKNNSKNAAVLYQTADRFVNEFITAIRFNKVHKFQGKYKDIDVLLIDDIQFISNKEQTQEAFFHIFNSLYDAHKQIVFSSDTFPQHMQGIAERLRSRLACGLVTDIYVPSLETKIAILKKKADMSDGFISDDVAHFIASRVVLNIRELEGALVRVMAFASLTKQPINIELARRVLIRPMEQQPKSIDFDTVICSINKHYSCSLNELRSKIRSKEITFVRQVTMFLLKKLTDRSLRDIGLYLGGRDHSTVMHAIAKIEQHKAIDPALQSTLNMIEQELSC